jgi:hypothetical protein
MESRFLNREESKNLSNLIYKLPYDGAILLAELGLMIIFEMGEICITDRKRWMLGKIKYGI